MAVAARLVELGEVFGLPSLDRLPPMAGPHPLVEVAVPVHGLDGALLAVRDEHAWVGDVVLWHWQRVARQVRLDAGLVC